MKRPIGARFFHALLALAVLSAAAMRAADPDTQLPRDFIARLEAATGSAEQEQIVRAAAPTISRRDLRKQLLTRAYQLTLTGDYLRAAADCDLVLRLAQETGAGEDAAAAKVELAFVLRESGDLAGALTAINQAVAFYQAHPHYEHGLISAEQARGIIYLVQSDFAHALESLHRALTLSQKIEYREGIIPALNSLGEVYRTQGQPRRALEFYERARAEVGDDNAWNMAFIFNNIGMSYDALGELDRAIENIQRARVVAEKAKFRPRVENALAVLGDLEMKRGRLDEARGFYEQSLQLARESRDVGGEAQAILGGAKVAHARGDSDAALEQAKQAAALSRQVAQLDQLVPALTLTGRCWRALGRDDQARPAFEEAIAAVEEMRGRVGGGEIERESFFAQQIEPYHEMVALLVRQKQPEKALAMAERASARVLLDISNGGRAEWSAILTGAERKTQRQLIFHSAQARRELSGERAAEKPDPAALAKRAATLHEAQRAEEDFTASMQAAHSELRRTALPDPLESVQDLAPLLRDGKTTLLRFVVTAREAFLFVATSPHETERPRLRVISLGQDRARLARLTNAYRSRLALRSLAWEKEARDLYGLLLQPAEAELQGATALVIVPDGPLWELPFQTLESAADHPLLVDHSIRYAPSLTLLARLENAPPAVALLAFVNPAPGEAKRDSALSTVALQNDEWEPLPQTEMQAEELRKIYPAPAGHVLVGTEAREKVFKEEAAEADILHFATHGVLDDRAPLYSYLLLSQVNVAPDQDGRLEARELCS